MLRAFYFWSQKTYYNYIMFGNVIYTTGSVCTCVIGMVHYRERSLYTVQGHCTYAGVDLHAIGSLSTIYNPVTITIIVQCHV